MKEETSSPNKLKERLSAFKFESPVRRSPRCPRSDIKEDSDQDTSLVLNIGPLLQLKNAESSSPLETPSTPRKRKFKQDIDTPVTPSSAKKPKRGYAPPEQYAHLNFLQDYLQGDLDIMFCGVNPGCMSAKVGHHFANPTNHFWRCLHRSGLTDRLLPASEDFTLPEIYNLGLTNLVDRPSAEQAELSKQDMILGVPVLIKKIRRFHPRIVTFVGKGIWETFIKEASKLVQVVEPATDDSVSGSGTPAGEVNGSPIMPVKKGRAASKRKAKGKVKAPKKPPFEWGIQPFKVVHENCDQAKDTLFFVMPSTSGRVVSHQLNDKVGLFAALRERLAEVKNTVLDTSGMVIIPASPHEL